MTFAIPPQGPAPGFDPAIAGVKAAQAAKGPAPQGAIDPPAKAAVASQVGLAAKALGGGDPTALVLMTKQAKIAQAKADKNVMAALDKAGNGDDTLSQAITRLAIGRARADDGQRLKAAGLTDTDVANMGPASHASMLHAMMSGITTIDEYVDIDNLCQLVESKGLSKQVANEMIDRIPVDKLFLLNYAHTETRTFFTPYKTGDVPVLGQGYDAAIFKNLFTFQDTLGDVAEARSKAQGK